MQYPVTSFTFPRDLSLLLIPRRMVWASFVVNVLLEMRKNNRNYKVKRLRRAYLLQNALSSSYRLGKSFATFGRLAAALENAVLFLLPGLLD